jgi:23S rRNA (guanosine2251-2'-O)-methyltransferase
MSKNSRNSGFQRKTGKKALKSGESGGSQDDSRKRAYGMRSHGAVARPKSPKSSSKRAGAGREGGSGWIWGAHACQAVLANPRRTIHEILLTEHSAMRYKLPHKAVPPKIVLPNVLDKAVPREAVHQGIAIKAAPLEWPDLEVIADEDGDGLILVLDQITDPHNVGAMLRLCSAFGVRALVMQTRKAPPLSGALAKVAVGCLETVPVCLVTNIANSLQNLQRIGWHVTGLAGETDIELSEALKGGGKQVIVMGAEGPGLRERVRKTCDQLAKIPMMSEAAAGQAESLNVATAAAIALYEARRS